MATFAASGGVVVDCEEVEIVSLLLVVDCSSGGVKSCGDRFSSLFELALA